MHAERPSSMITWKWIWGPRFKVGADVRWVCALVGLACVVVLALAIYLEPDPKGYGTHRGLSDTWPPCSIILISGLPCPTCGMTTAFSNAVRGRVVAAFIAQPAGLVFCVATVVGLIYSTHVAVTGWMKWVNWDRIATRLMLGLGLLILAGWGFKMAYGLLTDELPIG